MAGLLQDYTYDGWNRLKTVQEKMTAAPSTIAWAQEYLYDRWGNRAVKVGSYIPNSDLTPQVGNEADLAFQFGQGLTG